MSSVFLILLLMISGGVVASSADIVQEETSPVAVSVWGSAFYFVDVTGEAKPFMEPDVARLRERYGFSPLQNLSENFGYKNFDHWMLISLADIALDREPWFLEYDYPLVDYLDVYFKPADHSGNAAGAWTLAYQTGDMRPYESRPVDFRSYYFPIPADSKFILLRLRTEGSLVMPMMVVNGAHVLDHVKSSTLVYGLFFGALAIMCVYNLFVYLFTRERSYFYYVSTLTFILLYLLAMSGYGYELLWRQNGQWVNAHIQPIAVGFVLASASLFTREVLKLVVYLPRLGRVLEVLAKVGVAISIAGFFLPLHSLIHLISVVPLFVVSVIVVAAVGAIRHKVQGSRLFLIAWSAGLLGAMAFALHQLGFVPSHPVFVHSLKVGVLLNTVLLSFSLVSHINSLKREKERAEEMAHENYRLALIDGLTNIPNRRAFDHQYRLEYRRAQRENSPLSILMIDVDYFKHYNDSYGHRQGDAVLHTVARLLSESLARPADSVYRYGGEEFVIMLPDTDVHGAERLGQRMVDRMADEDITHASSPIGHITVSIGGTTELHFQQDLLVVLERADEALYQAKRDGRNRCHVRKPHSNIHQFHSPKPNSQN